MAEKLKEQEAKRIASDVVGNNHKLADQSRRTAMRRHPLRGFVTLGCEFLIDAKATKRLTKEFFPEGMRIDTSDIMDLRSDFGNNFEPLSEAEVKAALENMKDNIKPGPDGIPYEFLKLAGPLILPRLVRLFQSSIDHQHCPLHFRQSLTYVFRKPHVGDYTTPEAYRPLVMRNTLSKLLESIVASRIKTIVEKQELLPINQWRGPREAELNDARGALLDRVYSAWKEGSKASLLLIDDLKGFENASHKRLVYNLQRQRLPTKLVGWIRSFLSHQRTSIRIPGCQWNDSYQQTEHYCLEFGLSRGSPMSDILYRLYTASLPRALTTSVCWLLLDGTLGILAWSKSTAENCTLLATETQKLREWMLTNGSLFDMQSPRLIHFAKDNQSTETILDLDGNRIRPSKLVFILGMIFDCQLYWRHHRHFIGGDVSTALGSLHTIAKHSRYMKQSTLVDIFYGNVLFTAIQGYSFWQPREENGHFYSRNKATLDMLSKIQDRAITAFSSTSSCHVSSFPTPQS